MDPLSIIASTVAVAHALHVSLRTIVATRRARPELTALYNEVSDLRLVLQELELTLEQQERESGTPPPNSRLLESINLSKQKLDQLSAEVASWNLQQPLLSPEAEQKRFRLLRIANKAQKFREELKEIKVNLSTQLSILSA